MSTVDRVDSTKSFVLETQPLLLEYQQELKSIHDRVRELIDKIPPSKPTGFLSDKLDLARSDFDLLRRYFKAIQPPAQELSEHVSQRITHGDLGWSDRIDLQLRLAQFEHLLNSTEMVLAKGAARFIDKK